MNAAVFSQNLTQTVNSLPATGFQGPVLTNVGANVAPRAMAAADFNGDGKADLAMVDFNSARVFILLGNGDGTFQTPVTYTTAGSVLTDAITTGDFNGDGNTDIVVDVTDFLNNSVETDVLLGNGDGTFQTARPNHFGVSLGCLATADLNGDGKADLVSCAGVLLGNGDGTFQPPITSISGAYNIATADFNGDGIPDIVAPQGSAQLGVWIGKGDGTFLPVTYYSGGYYVAVGDFNGDGKPDLVSMPGEGAVVLLGNGDGTFQNPSNFLDSGFAAVVSDFNGDGKLDIAIAHNRSSTFGVVYGNGDGTFSASVEFNFGLGASIPLTVADFNGDGITDVAYPWSPIEVLLGVNSPPAATTTTVAATPVSSVYGAPVSL